MSAHELKNSFSFFLFFKSVRAKLTHAKAGMPIVQAIEDYMCGVSAKTADADNARDVAQALVNGRAQTLCRFYGRWQVTMHFYFFGFS